jgi:hypothetical protein
LITWFSAENNPLKGWIERINVQVIDSLGNKVYPYSIDTGDSLSTKLPPKVSVNCNGNFLVYWNKPQESYAQLFDNKGAKIGSNILLSTNMLYAQLTASNDILSITLANNALTLNRHDIKGQFVKPGIHISSMTYVVNPKIIPAHNGNALVCWNHNLNIFAQQFDSLENKIGQIINITNNMSGRFKIEDYTIAQHPDGRWIAAWAESEKYESIYGSRNASIKAQRYNSDGTPFGTIYTLVEEADEPSISFLGNDIALTYSADRRGKLPDIYFKKFPWDWNGITNITDIRSVPDQFVLEQNFPNPFNPTTTIRYSVGTNARSFHNGNGTDGRPFQHVSIKIYDILGREAATLVNEEQTPGWKEVQWNAKNCASGLYFYRLQAGNTVITRRMMLLK